jgi:hypothetical protein
MQKNGAILHTANVNENDVDGDALKKKRKE